MNDIKSQTPEQANIPDHREDPADGAGCLEAALQYLSCGWPAIPIGWDEVKGGWKKPLIKWQRYQAELPSEADVRSWWRKWPFARVGVVTGRLSGLVVVDFDLYKGGSVDGLDLPPTLVSKTGGGGFHYLYRHPGDREISNATDWPKRGIDIRGDGGFIVAAPSLHLSGQLYEWPLGFDPSLIAPCPQWLLDSSVKDKPPVSDLLNGVSEGSRNDSATRVIGSNLLRLPQDEWSGKGWKAAKGWNEKNNPPLEEEELKTVFQNIANAELKRREALKHKRLTQLSPAQEVKEGVLYIAVKHAKVLDGEIIDDIQIVTSDRQSFSCTKSEMLEHGFYSKKNPNPPERWSMESMEAFLSGSSVPIAQAFQNTRKIFAEFIDSGDPRFSDTKALWCLATYLHCYFPAFPYLRLNGFAESGKSKTLSLLALFGFNGEHSVNSSAAYLVRCINDNSATVCMDEMEGFDKVKDDEIRTLIGLLNSGYKRGATRGIVQQNGKNTPWQPVKLDSYSPKALASIGGVLHSLDTRCIPITMIASQDKAIRNREVNLGDPRFQTIRDEIYTAILSHADEVMKTFDGLTDDEISGRDWENWKPIFAFALNVDPNGDLYRSQRQLALELIRAKKEAATEGADLYRFLLALEELGFQYPSSENLFSTKEVSGCLQAYDSEAFNWLAEHKQPGRWIGKQLKHAGVTDQSVTKSRAGKKERLFFIDPSIIHQRLVVYDVAHSCPFSVPSVTASDSALNDEEKNGNREGNRNISTSVTVPVTADSPQETDEKESAGNREPTENTVEAVKRIFGGIEVPATLEELPSKNESSPDIPF